MTAALPPMPDGNSSLTAARTTRSAISSLTVTAASISPSVAPSATATTTASSPCPEKPEYCATRGQIETIQRQKACGSRRPMNMPRSEEHTSELQSRENLVCRLLLEKKNEHRLTTVVIRA